MLSSIWAVGYTWSTSRQTNLYCTSFQAKQGFVTANSSGWLIPKTGTYGIKVTVGWSNMLYIKNGSSVIANWTYDYINHSRNVTCTKDTYLLFGVGSNKNAQWHEDCTSTIGMFFTHFIE